MRRKVRKLNKDQSSLQKVIFLLIFVAILSAVYYLTSNNKTLQIAGKKAVPGAKNNASAQNQKTLDCSKKISEGKDLLAQGSKASDCFFMGCGDFFQ